MRADVVVVGGGVQGVTMALAAHRKGLKPVLVERSEIGSGATGNSYGIVHGGLRYLQTLDLPRWRRSRQAQCWFLANYPDFVRPLACVMPLYRGCFRSRSAFRTAAALEALLFNVVGGEPPLPRVRLLSPHDVLQTYPVPAKGLTGAALWYDAGITDLSGWLGAMLNEVDFAADALLTNCEAIELCVSDEKVQGVRVREARSGDESIIKTATVINCSGSWVKQWNPHTTEPSSAALAFNLLLDLPFPGESALAVSERPGRGRSYFLRPLDGVTFAGTFYRAAAGETEPAPTNADVRQFVESLDRALPGFGIADAKLLKVMPGLLPDTDGSGRKLSSRDYLTLDHPQGFHTVVGGKLTTAPLLSFDAANRIWPEPVHGKLAA